LTYFLKGVHLSYSDHIIDFSLPSKGVWRATGAFHIVADSCPFHSHFSPFGRRTTKRTSRAYRRLFGRKKPKSF
jgi:hypothetical protein